MINAFILPQARPLKFGPTRTTKGESRHSYLSFLEP